jgi:hypothetical protein
MTKIQEARKKGKYSMLTKMQERNAQNIWAKSARLSTKMLQLEKTRILDPSGGVLHD